MMRGSILAIAIALIGACTARGQAPRPGGEPPVLRAGTSGDYPPFSELSGLSDDRPGEPAGDDDGEGQVGRFSGFSVALVEAYAAERGRRVEWVRFRWPDLVADLEAGQFEMADSGITVRPERSIAGRFTVPVVRTGAVLLLRRPAWALPADAAGDPLAAIRALDQPRLRLAVNRGGHLERVARSQFRLAQITAIADNAAVREALVSGQVDAALSNTIEAPYWAAGTDGIELIGPLTRDLVAIYVRAEQRELAADLDAWLLAQEAGGALGRMRARYLGSGAAEPTALPVQGLLAATAERLALMPLVGAAKQRAGMPIDDAAQEARVLAAARAQVQEISAALGLPPPRDEALTEFFQAQIDAAKTVQRRAHRAAGTGSSASSPAYSLDGELRPAIARISERMAALLPRVPGGLADGLDRRAVRQLAREYLAASGLEDDDGGRAIERIADAIVALGASPPDVTSARPAGRSDRRANGKAADMAARP